MPKRAVLLVNCDPVSCIPSPLSPANFMTTSGRSSSFVSIILIESAKLKNIRRFLTAIVFAERKKRRRIVFGISFLKPGKNLHLKK
jgi:hypothetical protein